MRDVGLINGLHRLLIDAVRARVGRLEAGARNMRPRKKATLTPAASALIEEGDGQRNRCLASCSFRFPNRLSEKPADVPRSVPKHVRPQWVAGDDTKRSCGYI